MPDSPHAMSDSLGSSDDAHQSLAAVKPTVRFPQLVITRLTARRAAWGALAFGVIFDITIIATMTIFQNNPPETREFLARTLSANAGLKAMLGDPRSVETVGGFVEWRGLGVLVLIGAVWGLFVAAKLLRGEEDAGRWEILLTGRTTRGRGAAEALAGLGASLLPLFAVTAVPIAIGGQIQSEGFSAAGSMYLTFCFTLSVLIGMATSALASQLAPTRRTALTWGAGALGAFYLGRAVADSAPSLAWVRNLTPLGWLEELHPLSGGRPVMLFPLAVFILMLCLMTIVLAGRRDLGSSSLPDRTTAKAQTRLLGGPLGLAIRLSRGNLLAWMIGLAVLSSVYGLVAKTAADALSQISGFQNFLNVIGARSRAVENFFGAIFYILTTVLTLYAAAAANANREEEAQGFLDNLITRSVSRVSWLTKRLMVNILGLLLLCLIIGVVSWLAAYSQETDIALTSLLAAAFNGVPAAIFVLGIATLCYGLLPRLVSIVGYGIVIWSFLVELVGSAVSANELFLNLSLFHHIALMPAANFRWQSAAAISGLGLAAMALGTWFFNRRDIAGW